MDRSYFELYELLEIDSYMADIQELIFLDTIPDDARSELIWDDNPMAWVENRTLYIAGNGGVNAPADCTCLFCDFPELRKIQFNGCFHTDKTENMEMMFSLCEKLEEVDVGDFDTSRVTNMKSMFAHCTSLKFLDVSRWDTSKVTDMSHMFNGCKSLEILDVTKWNTANVTDMENMFFLCSAINVSPDDLQHIAKRSIPEDMFYETPYYSKWWSW